MLYKSCVSLFGWSIKESILLMSLIQHEEGTKSHVDKY